MNRKYILPLLLLVQIIFLRIISHFPNLVETYYSNGIYPYLSNSFRIIFGSIPFSVGDCVYTILSLMAIRWFWIKRKSWRNDWKNLTLEILSVLSIIYFFFNLLWALNYYRQPLYEKLNISTEYSPGQLNSFTEKLIAKTNALQVQITKDAKKPVRNPYSQTQIFEMCENGYRQLSKENPIYKFEHLSTKKSLYSLPLAYMGFSGYLNPFSNEAHLNDKMLMYTFPTVACHEMAHQIGIGFEDEANFVGFMASKKNPDPYFQYSAYTMALTYCLTTINKQSDFEKMIKKLNPGILKNFEENKTYWEQYNTPIETFFSHSYDGFLKFNNQKEGMDSYNHFVDLLVNYYDTRSL